MKKLVSRGDFSCHRRLSIVFATAYVEVKNQLSQGRRILCFGYVYVLPEVRNLPNNSKKTK